MSGGRLAGWTVLALGLFGLAAAPGVFFSSPVAPPPPPPRLTGRLIVPPGQLFGALLAMAQGTDAPFTPSQCDEVRRLLQRWQVQEVLARQALDAIGRQLASLDRPQRAVLDEARAEAPGPPAWDRLLDLLAARAGSTPPSPPRASAAAGRRYAELPPGVVVGGLMRMQADAALALTPGQAAALLGPLRTWRMRDEAFLDLTIRLGEALDAKQRDVVRRRPGGDRTSARDVLEALPPLPSVR